MCKNAVVVVVLVAVLALSMAGCSGSTTADEGRVRDSFSAVPSDVGSEEPDAASEAEEIEEAETPEPAGNTPDSERVANMEIAKQTDQIVLVQANEDTTAGISLYEHQGNAWNCTYSSAGCVGMNGVGQVHEGSLMTPEGAFGLGFAFGNGANPGTDMEWRDVTGASVWVDDPSSAYYNQWVESDEVAVDWSSAEYLAGSPGSYKYCVFIQYNVDPVVPGAGSAFFFHCYSQAGSWGCVQTGEADMVEYLQRLHDGAMIVIAYGDDVFGY